jgi:putative methionine-R-sulfoxide reductase with GAF domain/uncharacterized damage-inducible protein DinB
MESTRGERDRLEEQLRLAFEGEAWHGPSVMEALQDVSAEIASEHPIAGAHSIWELVLHLAGTYRVVLRRLTGDASALAASDDWPSVPLQPTESDWVTAITALRELNAQMRRAVADFPHDRLDEPLVEHPTYSAYTQFIGLTQHDLYHAGQIVLLKRAVRAERRRAALDRLALLADADGGAAWESAAESIRSAGSYRWVGLYEVGETEIGAIAWTGVEAPVFPRFPRETGLNGAAVASGEPVIAQDVSTDSRYLTAFPTTASEGIFPVLGASGEVIGTIDVESDRRDAFSAEDERFLRACASALQPLWVRREAVKPRAV